MIQAAVVSQPAKDLSITQILSCSVLEHLTGVWKTGGPIPFWNSKIVCKFFSPLILF